MSKIIHLSKEFVLELLNTHCFANLPEDTDFELLGEEEKDKRVVQLNGKIADLEAKLAESEEAIKYLKGIKRYDIGEMLTENTKLKQQLAEKDLKIIELETKLNLKDKETNV